MHCISSHAIAHFSGVKDIHNGGYINDKHKIDKTHHSAVASKEAILIFGHILALPPSHQS